AAKQNEMIREYEKKFADQKSDYEVMIDSIKEDSNKGIRDQDRAHRREVDDLTKAYEQKLAQQEQQMKERERVTTQNHEQELDNMRRAHNALLQRRNV
ncbi:MAG: hypothetical protein HY843_02655, partial [Bdellovibrio sp.]|nr:hypothetical protein [Bdellovibrio sp.]